MENKYQNQKVLIFGLGLNQGGIGSAKFFAKKGAKVRVTDLKSAEVLKSSIDQLSEFRNIEFILGKHQKKDFDWADSIIKNPSVKPENEFLIYALSKGKKIEMDMGIFLDHVNPSQIIGVTGTKGKSTTSSLIYEALKANNKSVLFAGNIGKSVLDTLEFLNEKTLVILEISSFQLESFNSHQASPHWAVITNITPDHLNYYTTMDEYIQAKKLIGKYQTSEDYLFLKEGDTVVDTPQFLEGLKGKIIRFSKNDLPADFRPNLKGEHNLNNIAAALAVTNSFGLSQETILNSLQSFKGVPFRMELVKVWDGVKIYNDTTATGPDAGIKALEAFPNCILIAGGMNKNMPYEEYANTVDEKAKMVFFLEGDSTDLIKNLMKRQEKNKGTFNNLEQLLGKVKEVVKEEDIILFSPAATSFNLFQNEFDRGRKFNAAVEKVFSA